MTLRHRWQELRCIGGRTGTGVLLAIALALRMIAGRVVACRKGMYSHRSTGGWILGNTIDGTQAEFVRIPHADTSLYLIPAGADGEGLVMLSDILPTGFECGVLNGRVAPGATVAIVVRDPSDWQRCSRRSSILRPRSS